MRTILTTMLLGVALLGAVPHAEAFGMGGGRRFMGGPGGPGGHRDPAGMPLRLLASEMTTDQRRQVRQILVADRAQMQDTLKQLRDAHEALATRLFAAGPLTAKDLVPDVQRIDALHQKLLEHGTSLMLQVRAIATPEQLAKAAQSQKRLRELRDEMQSLLGHEEDGDDVPGDAAQ
ncbi:MAG: periplasmic heavy metal sensor [Candidatus Binatia bacterium]